MSGHTPWPWFCNLVQKWPFGVEVVSESGRFIFYADAICHSSVQKTRADNEAGLGFKEESGEAAAGIAEQDANALLIAAAPELLDALKYSRRFLNAADHDVAFVDAAIAAATGDNS